MGLCIVCVVNFLWIVWLTFLFLEAYQQTEFRLILLHTNSLERDTLLLFQFFKSANRFLKLWNVKLLGKLFGPICFEMAKMGTADLNNFYIANCVAFCGFLFFFFLYGLMKYIYDFFFILQFFCGNNHFVFCFYDLTFSFLLTSLPPNTDLTLGVVIPGQDPPPSPPHTHTQRLAGSFVRLFGGIWRNMDSCTSCTINQFSLLLFTVPEIRLLVQLFSLFKWDKNRICFKF